MWIQAIRIQDIIVIFVLKWVGLKRYSYWMRQILIAIVLMKVGGLVIGMSGINIQKTFLDTYLQMHLTFEYSTKPFMLVAGESYIWYSAQFCFRRLSEDLFTLHQTWHVYLEILVMCPRLMWNSWIVDFQTWHLNQRTIWGSENSHNSKLNIWKNFTLCILNKKLQPQKHT